MDYKNAEEQFNQLRARYKNGELTEDEFNAERENLRVQDDEGNYWTMGAEAGKWFRSEADKWVEAEPPWMPPLMGTNVMPPTAPPEVQSAVQPPMPVGQQPAPEARGGAGWLGWLIAAVLVFLVVYLLINSFGRVPGI